MLSKQFEFLQPVFNAFRRKGFKLFLVGGCVRDYLLAKDPLSVTIKDFDLCTDAPMEETQKILSRLDDCVLVDKNGGNFGTIMCTLNGEDVEITTFRKNEEYAAGSRRPDLDKLQFSKNIEDDLVRRDFTINAIAVDERGGLASGMCSKFMEDLKARVLRTPQEPGTLMRDDPLRILRMYRFAHRLGFKIDPALRQAARDCSVRLRHVSTERCHTELVKIAAGKDAPLAFREMMEDGVLRQLVPALAEQVGREVVGTPLPQWELTLRFVQAMYDVAKGDHCAVFAGLFHDVKVEPTMKALIFSTRDTKRVQHIVSKSYKWFDLCWDRSTARKFVNDCGEDFRLVLALMKVTEESRNRPVTSGCSVNLLNVILRDEDTASLVNLDTFLDGEDVKKMLRMPAGPKVGEILKALKESVLRGSITSREEAENWLTMVYPVVV